MQDDPPTPLDPSLFIHRTPRVTMFVRMYQVCAQGVRMCADVPGGCTGRAHVCRRARFVNRGCACVRMGRVGVRMCQVGAGSSFGGQRPTCRTGSAGVMGTAAPAAMQTCVPLAPPACLPARPLSHNCLQSRSRERRILQQAQELMDALDHAGHDYRVRGRKKARK